MKYKLRKRKRLKNFILNLSHINQSPFNEFPIIFTIQHNNIFFEIYVIKISNSLELKVSWLRYPPYYTILYQTRCMASQDNHKNG